MSLERGKHVGRKRKLVRKVLLITNITFIFLLLLSYLTAFISPQYIWWTELFALAYGSLLGVNILFVFLWAVLRKKYFLYSLMVILIGISRLFGIFQFRFAEHPATADHSSQHLQLKLMTYNVHVFDLYNWNGNHEFRGKIFELLNKESPDIACLQEFFSSDRKKYDYENADTLKQIMSAGYAHLEYTLHLHGGDHWGIATYSKYPIINKQAVSFGEPGGNIFIYSDIAAGIDTFRVFNVHLESDRFQPADYRFVQDLDVGKHEESQVKGLWKRIASIVSRLKNSAIKRAQQAKLMEQYISESPYPVIVCGDFNDTPSSYTYSTLCSNLEDSFRKSGSGFGKTYIGSFPSFRIDYILHDKKIESTGYHTGKEKYSDHYPVSCVLQRK